MLVAEDRVGEAFAIGEMLDEGRAVVGDGDDAEAPGFKLRALLFQLDELGFAEGSPVGGADKQEKEAFGSAEIVEVAEAAGLVGELEGGDALADGGAGFHVLVEVGEGVEALGE